MSTRIELIRLTDYADAVVKLSEEHWKETEAHLTDDPPKPSIDAYKYLEEYGCEIAFGAFNGDELIGYAAAFVIPHIHYGFLYGNHDILFIKKEYRAGSLGLRLIRSIESEVKNRGARFMLWHAKPGTNFETILKKTGAVTEEIIYRKEL